MKKLAVLAVLVHMLAGIGLAAAPSEELVKKLTDTIHKQCPEATIEVTKEAFTAKYGTMEYTLHSCSMTGEVSEKTYQREGPNFKGFMLRVSLNEGKYEGQAMVPQTLHDPYYLTFLDAVPVEDGRKHYDVRFSYGGRLDPDLMKAIFESLPRVVALQKDKVDAKTPTTAPGESGFSILQFLSRKPIGLLGEPLGARVVVEGKLAEHVLLANPLAITKVNGKTLPTQVNLELEKVEQIKSGVVYKFEGYESGAFAGDPMWVSPAVQQSFQYRPSFIVVRAIASK